MPSPISTICGQLKISSWTTSLIRQNWCMSSAIILSRSDQPQSFAQIVEQIERASHQHAALPMTAHFVAAELSILMLGALVRPTRGGFVITKVGCDICRSPMEFISQSQNATAAIDNAASAALSQTGVPQTLYSGSESGSHSHPICVLACC